MYEEDAAKIPEDDWLKLQSHINRTYGLAKTRSYLTTASLLVMMGRNDPSIMEASGMTQVKKEIVCPFGCSIVDNPFEVKFRDQLAGDIRGGVTDLPYRIKTSSGSHDLGIGLDQLGWEVNVFKILERTETDPEKKLEITINNVIKFLKSNIHVGNITVHLWLSFSFVLLENPPHTVLLSNRFVENATDMITALDRAASRPILVALCPDSMFNMVDSRTTRIAKDFEESLGAKQLLVTTATHMWRSFHGSYGQPYRILDKEKKGTLGKTTIWAMIEKYLFRQRVLLMCSSNRDKVDALNEIAGKTDMSGIDRQC